MSARNFDIIDFHAHILPGADHGSFSLAESKKQLEYAASHGVNTVVATPHFYPESHSVEQFLSLRQRTFEDLSTALTQEMPRVILGAEVLICDGIEHLDKLHDLCVKGTDIILLELPFTVFKTEYRRSVSRLINSGFEVVLAHADRYTPEHIDILVDRGAKIQLNADALCGIFVKPHIKRWLNDGTVLAIGSDIHRTDIKAYKRFEKAKSKILTLGASDSIKAFSEYVISKV